MRWYRGYVLGFSNAVSPVEENVVYSLINIWDKKGRHGIVKYGYDREYEVGLASVIEIQRKCGKEWKRRLYRIPFEYVNGRYEFDLPGFLKSKGIRYKLYKRYDLHGGCNAGYYVITSAYGEITYCSYRGPYDTDYNASISFYRKNATIQLDGKAVESVIINGETTPEIYGEEALAWYRSLIENPRDFTYEEFGRRLEKYGVSKNNYFLYIIFCDGTLVHGREVFA